MSLCINPYCPNPNGNDNSQLYCQACGSELLLEGLYRVRRELGGGGFGKTYEVAQGNTLKVLKILTFNNPDTLRLFQQEAEVLGKLNHPGIPKVEPDGYFVYFPKDSQESLHCIVMEKIEGEDLETYLENRGKPISQKLALKWLLEIADVLHQIHQQGFLHRDIKPSNIMLRPDGQLVLIDFGTVKEITATVMSSQAKKQGTGVYTPGYAPPEQEKGYTVLKSDFFALGRTMVHLLTNQYPLALYNPDTDELNWRGAAPNVSPLLADFLDQLMQRLAKDRPQDTGVILQRLGEIDRQIYPPSVPPVAKTQLSVPIQPLETQVQPSQPIQIPETQVQPSIPFPYPSHSLIVGLMLNLAGAVVGVVGGWTISIFIFSRFWYYIESYYNFFSFMYNGIFVVCGLFLCILILRSKRFSKLNDFLLGIGVMFLLLGLFWELSKIFSLYLYFPFFQYCLLLLLLSLVIFVIIQVIRRRRK